MRKANSELYIRNAKVEKDFKKITQRLKVQKVKSSAEKEVVVDRMRMVCDRDIAIAVSNATVHLASDLKKSKRGVAGLQKTLGMSEVIYFEYARLECEALAIFCCVAFSNVIFS
jgi:hypothetical protein